MEILGAGTVEKRGYSDIIKNRINPQLGHILLADLTPYMLEDFFDQQRACAGAKYAGCHGMTSIWKPAKSPFVFRFRKHPGMDKEAAGLFGRIAAGME